ncbi:Exosome complex component RRP41-like [Glycine max]|nr:Exosome complex component RRP41-like [Glycine max]
MKTGSSSSPQPTTIGKGKKTEKLKRATVWEWRAKVEQLRRHTRHLRRPIGRRNHRFSRRIGFDPMAAVFTSADPLFRTGAVNAASGSAYAEFGNTKVIVSVFGPRESKKAMMYSDIGRLNCNVSFTTFATPIRGQGSDHKEYCAMLHKALEGAIILETFPKTTVDVFALVLESSGSDLPVVISCASLALADAGIMMYDIVASVSVSCFNKNLVIDPILEEEIGQDGSLMITCMPSRYEITQLTVTGEWSTTKINEGMQLCLDACAKLAKIMRSCLKEVASDSQE